MKGIRKKGQVEEKLNKEREADFTKEKFVQKNCHCIKEFKK